MSKKISKLNIKLLKWEEDVFKRYKKSAETRGYSFSLTNNQFKHLISSDCFYCGEKPRRHFNGVIRNGIDRVVNDIGYKFDNVIACCTACNKMKGKLTYSEFVTHTNKVSNKIDEFTKIRNDFGLESPSCYLILSGSVDTYPQIPYLNV